MQTIQTDKVELQMSGSNHVTINQTGISKEEVIKIISEHQIEMIKEMKNLDQSADEDRLLANLVRGHIHASKIIMKKISKL